MRVAAMVLAVVSLVVCGLGGYRFYDSFQRLPETEIAVPGSKTVELDAGTYRIYIRNFLLNGNQCDPERYADDVARMGLELRPAQGRTIRPRLSGSCDGGSANQTFKPASVAEFRVLTEGSYRLSGERQPGMTAFQRAARVYLVNSSHRMTSLFAAIGAVLLAGMGVPFLLTRGRRR